jgi:hypothetical protein
MEKNWIQKSKKYYFLGFFFQNNFLNFHRFSFKIIQYIKSNTKNTK